MRMSAQIMETTEDSIVNSESELLLQYAESIRPVTFYAQQQGTHLQVPLRLQELMDLLSDAIDEPMSRSALASETANLLTELEKGCKSQ